MNTRALIYLQGLPEEAAVLKRLALIFDEIHFVRPEAYSFTSQALDDPNIVRRMPDGRFEILPDFNFFEHVGREWTRQLTKKEDPELFDTIECLQSEGVAFEAATDLSIQDNITDRIYKKIKSSLIESTLGNEVFERLSETDHSQYDIQKRTTLVHFSPLEGESEPLVVPFISPPNLISDIDEITKSLFLSQKNAMASIFHVPRHRYELEFLYDKYTVGLKRLERNYPELRRFTDNKLKFGEVAFTIVNNVVSSASISTMSIEEVLRLRNTLERARKNFLSKGLEELTQLVKESPWSTSTAAEIEKYVSGKLQQDIFEYQKQSNEAWKKMYGRLAVYATTAVRNAAFGGATGAVAGAIAPGTSMWGMIALAAIGLAKEIPKGVEAIVDGIQEASKNSESSISYMSELSEI